jgi:uncharacterized DUF497 family protein
VLIYGAEWDEEKRQDNLVKHGVDFREMPELFDGPRLDVVDDRYNNGETASIAQPKSKAGSSS